MPAAKQTVTPAIYQIKATLRNHPEHESMLEWVGGEFDPEAFDLDEINKALRYVR